MHSEMENFVDILKGTDRADDTIRLYKTTFEQYSDWLDQESLDYDEVGPRDIKRYVSFLKNDKGYANMTVRSRFHSLSRFYSDITENGVEYDDPTDPVNISEYAPKTTKKEEVTKEKRDWITQDEVRQVVENVPSPKLRNRLLVLLQYYTALRRQEVVDIQLDDLDRESRQVKVRGKGDKVHTAYWQPKLDGLLTAWIEGGYRDASPHAEESPNLFLTNAKPHLHPSRVSEVVREAAWNAGIQEVLYEDTKGRKRHKVTSHTLRHSYAMHFLQNGGSIEALSKHLAHSSVEMTEIYGEILDERAKDEYKKYAPDIEFGR